MTCVGVGILISKLQVPRVKLVFFLELFLGSIGFRVWGLGFRFLEQEEQSCPPPPLPAMALGVGARGLVVKASFLPKP